MQPLRVQTLQSVPKTPPRLHPSTSPSLDTHPNPWIKIITTYLKLPQIPKASKTQAVPRQVQHNLRRSLRNFRQMFRTQAAQHLFANHLLNVDRTLSIDAWLPQAWCLTRVDDV